jgi:hypothetical protein
VVVVVLLGGCSGLRVETGFDPRASFDGYRTYAWLSHPAGRDLRHNIPMLQRLVTQMVEEALDRKGFDKEIGGSPDFLVGYHTAVEGRLDAAAVNSYYGYGFDWSPWHYPGRPEVQTDTYLRYYEEGVLIIDIVDARSNQLVWRGTARADLKRDATDEEREARVSKAVRKLLDDFPPQRVLEIR